MRAWYDIISLAPNTRQIDEAGLLASRAIVRQLIERETARGVPSEHIILAGFSQRRRRRLPERAHAPDATC